MVKLIGLDYTIQYKKGRENVTADALSRRRQEEGYNQACNDCSHSHLGANGN